MGALGGEGCDGYRVAFDVALRSSMADRHPVTGRAAFTTGSVARVTKRDERVVIVSGSTGISSAIPPRCLERHDRG